jgi:hypothetical protein
VATTAVFFIDGAMMRTWIAHIPYMQETEWAIFAYNADTLAVRTR